MPQHIKHLFIKDLHIEWQHKYAIGGALLYLIATIFVSFLVFQNIIAKDVWIALFWIIIIFVSINTVARSFVGENKNRYYYYYGLCNPQDIILSKIIYNSLFLLTFTLISYLLFSVFFNNIIIHQLLFLGTIILGALGLSAILTMTSAIAWKAQNSFSLTAILSLPLILPLVIILVRLSHLSISSFNKIEAFKLLFILFLLNLLTTTLSYILFPYIWKD